MTEGEKPAAGGMAALPRALVYVNDPDTESLLRGCLSDLSTAATYAKGGIGRAIADLAQQESPRLLVVDISGVDDPIARIEELAQLCEPTTGVLVIGDANDVVLYRNLKQAGVVEYYFKPLVSGLVAETCRYILTGERQPVAARAGRLVTVLGVRGGVGATSIAAAAAWHIAEDEHRHVLLVDLDTREGDLALQLDQLPNGTLSEALRQPERVDDVFLDHGVIHVTARLDLLASLEPLGEVEQHGEDAVLSLLGKLLTRYRYVFVDLPPALAPQLPRLLKLAGAVILVSDSSLAAARDVVRWRNEIGANTQNRTTLHVLNKLGADGTLSEEEFVRAIGRAPDLAIHYQREIAASAMLGTKGLQDRATLRRALAPLLERITGEPAPAPRHSLFAGLLG